MPLQFAEATGDHQWIHVDPIRSATGPFGCCIAHGYLTLSLVNLFLPQLLAVNNLTMGINYGCDKIRFPNVVAVNSAIRAHGQIISASGDNDNVEAHIRVTIVIDGQDKPACVVDTISRYRFMPSLAPSLLEGIS